MEKRPTDRWEFGFEVDQPRQLDENNKGKGVPSAPSDGPRPGNPKMTK